MNHLKINNYNSTNAQDEFLVPKQNIFFFSNKFISLLTISGKKLKAYKLFCDTLVYVKKRLDVPFGRKSNQEAQSLFYDSSILEILSQALENIKPNLEVRKVRIAGSTYLVPTLLSKKKQETLAMKWIIESAKKRQKNSKLTFSQCLADELVDASKKIGQARQKRDELHRLAEANRAYIRYRWW